MPFIVIAQSADSSLKINSFSEVTSFENLLQCISAFDKESGHLSAEIIGKSVQERNIYALKFSNGPFGKDPSKIKVLIFAQQHGNEQSGKEGALLLAERLTQPGYGYLFDKIDLMLIPQVNPDGSEVNRRRNANDADLNRNHLILTQPETQALHKAFDRYLFEVSMDVHEYSPYGEEWKKYGYRKNSDITIGTTTNLAVSEKIRSYSSEKYLPYIFSLLNERGFTSFEYCPGGPPDISYIRHSTFDINDGRQSLGIQNTLSFIQEGMNGEDNFVENLEHRAKGQMTGMLGLLEFVFRNKDEIKELVHKERMMLASGIADSMVSLQSEHIANGQKLDIPLFSYFTGNDTVVQVNNYRPVVKSLYDARKPYGYLVPADSGELVSWVRRQQLTTMKFRNNGNFKIMCYKVDGIDSIDFEGDTIVDPSVTLQEFTGTYSSRDYIFIPTAQLKGNLLVLALEPKSMLGLVTYKDYAHLLQAGEVFPVLRVMER